MCTGLRLAHICSVVYGRTKQRLSYSGAHAGLAFLVLLVGHPLVQLAPQSLGPPVGDPGLQVAVEGAAVCRVQVHPSAEHVEGLQGPLAGRSLDKVLKRLADVVSLFLRHSHLAPPRSMARCAAALAYFSTPCQMWLHPQLGPHRHAQSEEARHTGVWCHLMAKQSGADPLGNRVFPYAAISLDMFHYWD